MATTTSRSPTGWSRPGSPKNPDDPYTNRAVLNELCSRAADRVDEFLYELGVKLRREGKRYAGPCPVHCGDNPQGFSLYADGYEARGNWQCRTRQCHKVFVPSLVGLVRGVLSREKRGWAREGDGTVRHRQAVDWVCKFLGVEVSEVKPDAALAERARIARDVDVLGRRGPAPPKPLCTPGQLRAATITPAPYYVDRGYSPEVLKAFGVGLVTDKRAKELGRVIVPVYDGEDRTIIGAVSRSLDPECPGCKLCHRAELPCPVVRLPHLRWRVVGDFRDKDHLYNVGRARAAARESRSVVVVEGPPDVWRLEEAGVRNAVALFGAEMTDPQGIAIQGLAPAHVVILTDNDGAGEAAAESVARSCGMFANVSRIRALEGRKDVGEMTADEVRTHLKPLIDAKARR